MDGAMANPAGWRGLLVQGALVLIAAFSALILFSFGGQVIVAPALLPAQWLIARNMRGAISMVFSVLGALLAAEVAWIALALVAGDGAPPVLVGLLLVAGLGVGLLFFKASRPRSTA